MMSCYRRDLDKVIVKSAAVATHHSSLIIHHSR
jgi:hypothetical protein